MTWKSLKNFLFAIIAQKKIKRLSRKSFRLPKAQEKSNEEKLLIYERSYKFRAWKARAAREAEGESLKSLIKTKMQTSTNSFWMIEAIAVSSVIIIKPSNVAVVGGSIEIFNGYGTV